MAGEREAEWWLDGIDGGGGGILDIQTRTADQGFVNAMHESMALVVHQNKTKNKKYLLFIIYLQILRVNLN